MQQPARSILGASILVLGSLLQAQEQRANYDLAKRYSRQTLTQFSYTDRVQPRWIHDSDRFHYSFRNSEGMRYWYVDAESRKKEPLFDHELVAAAITEASGKAVPEHDLRLSNIEFAKDGKSFKFRAGGFNFEYVRATQAIKKLGKVSKRRGSGNMPSREQLARMTTEQRQRFFEQMRRRQEQERELNRQRQGGRRGGTQPPTRSTPRNRGPRRSYSPDRSSFVYAKDHNLYWVKGERLPDPKPVAKKDGAKKDEKKKTAVEASAKKKGGESKGSGANGGDAGNSQEPASSGEDEKEKKTPAPRYKYDMKAARQLSKDGGEDYSFGGVTRQISGSRSGRSRFGGSSRISWAKNSKAFYTTRRDSRNVKELFIVDSVANPRPKLSEYKYAMPGDDRIRLSELHYFDVARGALKRLEPKWKDESYLNVSWHEDGQELRFFRRNRPRRKVDYCSLNPYTDELKVLVSESCEDGLLKFQPPKLLEKSKQMVWWSERSGWSHLYLYDMEGKLLHQITKGAWRVSSVLDIDEEKGWIYLRGNGREPGENIYYEHIYKVRMDGTGLTLLDPGDAHHRSYLSDSGRFLVDNTTRVDQFPTSVLRDGQGKLVMELERFDGSQLEQIGWRMPETFKVKAADGVTDLFGNMWKPFDFDPKKSYPIIAHVYPGPQQEGVTHTFSAYSSRQELAQLGFIVVQVGHRGGSPRRSRAYANYGYYNMRDYGLADKKAAIEQLALRHPYIDVNRVGIYGHSGGGFMSAAALLQKPYNEFFKVAVASAGNHDNNIYNNSWSERYHGLKEVKVEKKEEKKSQSFLQGLFSGMGKALQAGAKKTSTKSTDTAKKSGTTKKTTTQSKSGSKVEQKGGATRTVKQDDKSKTRRRSSWRERLAQRQKEGGKQETAKKQVSSKKQDTKFEIRIPTNAELAANLKGNLLLVHGEIDNNVHPANTMRLVDALIKANKRFDMLIIPGARHSFGRASTYFAHRMYEYFALHLLGDRRRGADIMQK